MRCKSLALGTNSQRGAVNLEFATTLARGDLCEGFLFWYDAPMRGAFSRAPAGAALARRDQRFESGV